eukprot:m.14242 g.14242  ORF g.14242 m.14242 type:complete len:350 (-) comp5044_c0_seq1:147-1196(-)
MHKGKVADMSESKKPITKAGKFSNVAAKVAGQTNVNGEEFWKYWAQAGGNVEQYVKESMPNYAITAGLLITMTFPLAVDPPDNVSEASDGLKFAFIAMMTVATAINILIIILTLTIYQQYCCTISKETALNFTAHFGYLVPLQGTALFLEIALLFTALVISIILEAQGHSPTSRGWFFGVTLVGNLFVFLVLVWLLIKIPSWNQSNNYVKFVEEVANKEERVGDIQGNWPELPSLIDACFHDSQKKAKAAMSILTDQGCENVEELVHFLQQYAYQESTVGGLGRYAQVLERMGFKPFDALAICDQIGIDVLELYSRPETSLLKGIIFNDKLRRGSAEVEFYPNQGGVGL